MNNPETNRGGKRPKSRIPNAPTAELRTARQRLEALERFVGALAGEVFLEKIKVFVFEGGHAPVRKTEFANGLDAYARAIVSKSAPQPGNILRDSRADFQKTPGWEERVDPALHIIDDPSDSQKYGVRLLPGERCMVGLGFATAMPFPMNYQVMARSGFAAEGINLDNAPGLVDSDYRGEAGALVTNRSDTYFDIFHDMRIVQLYPGLSLKAEFEIVERYEDLPQTLRGVGGFGSTGVHG